MEDLTNKILKADFSAKLNLIHYSTGKRLFQWGVITSFIVYGVYSHYGPSRTYSSASMKDIVTPGSTLFYDFITAERLNFRKYYRPEIYHREIIYHQKKYAAQLSEIVGKDRDYKPFIWG